MKTRAITGFFFLIIMVGSLLIGDKVFSVFYLLLSTATLYEFYKLIKKAGIRPHIIIGLIAAVLVFGLSALFFYIKFDLKYLLLIIPIVFSVFITELYKKSKIPFGNISYTFVGFIFITIPFIFFHALGFLLNGGDFNWTLPLGFLCMLWANDTGAYLFGVKFGKRKLFERHSPKKSWEGFFGGILTSLLVAYLFSQQFHELPLLGWLGMAIIISTFGTLGDLVESMLKRSFDTKDSGSLLPGHGGLLDRFDGLLLSAPIVYVYIYLFIN